MKDQMPTKYLTEVNAVFIKREKEAAKDPNHPNHDALKIYFAETERKLEEIKQKAK